MTQLVKFGKITCRHNSFYLLLKTQVAAFLKPFIHVYLNNSELIICRFTHSSCGKNDCIPRLRNRRKDKNVSKYSKAEKICSAIETKVSIDP